MLHLNDGKNKTPKVECGRSLRSRPRCALIQARPTKAGFSLALRTRPPHSPSALALRTRHSAPRSALALRTRPPLSPSALAMQTPPSRPFGMRLRTRHSAPLSALALRSRTSVPHSALAPRHRTPPSPSALAIQGGGSPAPAPPRPTASASGRRLRPRGHPLRNARRAPVACSYSAADCAQPCRASRPLGLLALLQRSFGLRTPPSVAALRLKGRRAFAATPSRLLQFRSAHSSACSWAWPQGAKSRHYGEAFFALSRSSRRHLRPSAAGG